MADETYAAYITPNVARFGEVVTIKLSHAPLKPAGPVQLKLYELNDYTWVDANDPQHTISWDEEDPQSGAGRGDDLLATWSGEIRWAQVSRDGANVLEPRFVPSGEPTIAHQGDDKTLFYKTTIPVQLDGSSSTFEIPLALDRKRQYEGDTLELGVRIDRGQETLFRGYYATLVRDWRWWAKNSFAPPRTGHKVKLYSCGQDYWADLADALMAAKKTIYMTGWALSAHVKLRRPRGNNQTLAAFLADAGSRGVQVRMLITDTSAMWKSFLNNWDEVAQAWLMAHPGIEVSRHRPDATFWDASDVRSQLDRPFWTHHQKTVMIDDSLAFVGGIDLTEGRWDTDRCDLDDANALEDAGYGDMNSDRAFQQREQKRNSRPRMPWHDIHARIEGPAARDVRLNFVQRWNRASDFQRKSLEQRIQHISLLEQRGVVVQELDTVNRALEQLVPGSNDMTRAQRVDELQKQLADLGSFDAARDLIQKAAIDYEVKIMVLTALYMWRFDQFAWTYVAAPMKVLFQGRYALDPDHLWSSYLGLLLRPKSRDQIFTPPGQPLPDSSTDAFTPLPEPAEPPPSRAGGAIVQVVRSISSSSLPDAAAATMRARTGQTLERSILDTYGLAINLAQHFVYIETQMFISQEIKLVDLLREKITQKMDNKERFHVYLVVPEVYDGNPFDTSDREVNFLQWKTISGLRQQLAAPAQRNGVAVDDYFQVFCLRKLGKLSVHDDAAKKWNQIARINLIYVHAKLMIVDDTFITVGSANLNQRSLLGDRDTEINVNILDDEEVTIKVGDPNSTDPHSKIRTFVARKTAHDLRMHLWRKHLGVDPVAEPGTEVTLQNPTHPATVKLWRDRALLNRSLSSGIFNKYYGTHEWNPPAAETLADATARGLRGFITTFGMEKEAQGKDTWDRPNFLTS